MSLTQLVFTCLFAAPALWALLRWRAGLANAAWLLPAALFVGFASRWAEVQGRGARTEVWAWVPSLDISLALRADGLSLLFALLSLGAQPLAVWFFDTSAAGLAAVQVSLGLLVLLGLLQFVGYPGLAALGLLRGQKDTRLPMIFKLVAYWVIGAPLGIWLCEMQGLGVTGLWIGLVGGAAITTTLTLARLYTRR